ncbi:hypothetical protein L596_021904 [Steinernema carpocapsae]|uniref:Uncharacterized protein n=1 Tax=Steinernema carpocapsae TaxID=34508 RepID=A0A4U5MK49_STECR|nr:hypothetical protein L596_021904 [Steinernema carpocapsae]
MRTFTSSGLQTLVSVRSCPNNYVDSFFHSNHRFHKNEQSRDQLAKPRITATRMCYRNCQVCKLKIRDVGSSTVKILLIQNNKSYYNQAKSN